MTSLTNDGGWVGGPVVTETIMEPVVVDEVVLDHSIEETQGGFDVGQYTPVENHWSFGRWFRELGWRYIVGIVALAFAIFPVLFVISAALNPIGSVASTTIIPTHGVTLNNFRQLFGPASGGLFWRWYLNTLVVCAFCTAVSIICSTLAAYAFSRLRFKGRRNALLALMLLMMFPNVLAMIALYTMFTNLGHAIPQLGLSTILGYAFAMTGGALGQVWLLKGTMDTIPFSLDEAATIDGAGHFTVFSRILLPVLGPILATTTLLSFTGPISEFLVGSLFLTNRRSQTLAVGLYSMLQEDRAANLGVFAAGAILTVLPVVLLFQYLQKYIVGGASDGAVKG